MLPDVAPEDVIAARRGDRAAFRRLVETLAGYTYNLARRMSGNAADAEDLSQEIFLRLFQNRQKYDPELPFAPWFRRLAVHSVLNGLRGRKRPLPIREADGTAGEPENDAPSEFVTRALRELPDDYRMVVTLHYFDGLGIEAIGTAMGRPAGTIKVWLFRARDLLREKWKSQVES